MWPVFPTFLRYILYLCGRSEGRIYSETSAALPHPHSAKTEKSISTMNHQLNRYYENYNRLGCNAVYFRDSQMFRRKISPPYSRSIMCILRILCYNGSLVTWTVVSLTTAKLSLLYFLYLTSFIPVYSYFVSKSLVICFVFVVETTVVLLRVLVWVITAISELLLQWWWNDNARDFCSRNAGSGSQGETRTITERFSSCGNDSEFIREVSDSNLDATPTILKEGFFVVFVIQSKRIPG
jgi:hypothetical protein